MKIGIDTRALLMPITGIGRYTQQVIENLHKIKKVNDQIIYFWGSGYEETDYMISDIGKSEHTHRIGIKGVQTLWEQFILPRRIAKHQLEVFHSPRNYNIPFSKVNSSSIILTMHDIIPFIYPKQYPHAQIIRWRWYLAARLADKIVTVSENSKRDILDKYNFLDNDDIVVNYCGLDEKFLYSNIDYSRIKEVKKKYLIDRPYLITTGGTEPIKNSKMLFSVMEHLDKENIELLIVGPKWPGKETPENIPGNVRFTGYVEEEDLPLLFSAAEIFLFPSLYEGFGLPPLEAMGAGTAVIGSKKSSLPEVIGEAGILLDPENSELWVKSIREVLADKDLQESLIEKGFIQSQKFSWRKTAEQLYEIYEREAFNSYGK